MLFNHGPFRHMYKISILYHKCQMGLMNFKCAEDLKCMSGIRDEVLDGSRAFVIYILDLLLRWVENQLMIHRSGSISSKQMRECWIKSKVRSRKVGEEWGRIRSFLGSKRFYISSVFFLMLRIHSGSWFRLAIKDLLLFHLLQPPLSPHLLIPFLYDV